MMTSVELIETLDNGSEYNPSQDYSHPDNETTLMLHHWSCFGVTDENSPPALLFTQHPPSFRLLVYI